MEHLVLVALATVGAIMSVLKIAKYAVYTNTNAPFIAVGVQVFVSIIIVGELLIWSLK
jgi:hypothetical protein